MDQDFQTSFIPKKPIIEHRAIASRPVGIFTIISFFVFFTILVASGGLYLYKGVLTKKLDQMKIDLELSKSRLEAAKIDQLETLDRRLRSSTTILSKHISIIPIFKTLQDVTMKTVRYTKFSYSFDPSKDSQVKIKMSGQAIGYRSIALQSDLFTKNKILIDPVFSNLSLDEKGNVLFDLDFSVDSSLINYKQTLPSTNESSSAPASLPGTLGAMQKVN